MSLLGRSIVSIDDLSNQEIQEIFRLADKMAEEPRRFWGSAAGKVLATLFYEPSTRTRLSFEAAMQRLGGGTISAWDIKASSVAKGETLADTVRVVAKYADGIVLRHPWEGAAYLAAQYAEVPIVNAGDGAHEHPTQTLCDLYTLRKKHSSLRGLTVALCGDLKNGRTVHSLAFALARFGASVVFVPGDGHDVPDYILHRLEREYGARIRRTSLGFLSALFGREAQEIGPLSRVNAIYMTPSKPHQLALLAEEGLEVELRVRGKDSFALYVTRFQREREGSGADEARRSYPRVTPDVLRLREFKGISILHPLPRTDELSPEVDQDPRSLYFAQAGHGVPVRMALIYLLLGLGEGLRGVAYQPYERPIKGQPYAPRKGIACPNQRCVTRHHPDVAQRFEVTDGVAWTLRCLYCDQEVHPAFFAYAGRKTYHPISSLALARSRLAHLLFFSTDKEASEAGYKPGRTGRARPRRALGPAGEGEKLGR